MQRLAAWFPVLLLAAVAAVTVWLDSQVQPPESVGNSKARHDPDYIVNNFTVTRIGPDGVVRYKLTARRMQHYPDDDTTLLDAPKLAGIELTENYAMTPTAAVSGYYFWRPESQYFGVGKVDRDQVEDYAARKGWSVAEAERWLAPNLGYDRR